MWLRLRRDDVLVTVTIVLLLFISLIDWSLYSFTILLLIVIMLLGWYAHTDENRKNG